MKVLVCMPHFCNRTRTTYHSDVLGSSVEPPEQRIETVRYCLRRLHALLSDTTFNITTSPSSRVGFDTVDVIPNAVTGDICLCFSRDDHFFPELESGGVIKGIHNDGDPRLLGYACRRVFADNLDRYDLYCCIEDDHAVLDPEFFDKVAHFHRVFGEGCVIMPSRFELAGALAATWKAYIDDGAFAHMAIEPPAGAEKILRMRDWRREIEFELTRSPFCGCYIITNSQLRSWMTEPDFMEPDPALIAKFGIFELVMIPMLGRLPTYKPAKRNAGFLETHHVPNRLCNGNTPLELLKKIAAPEINRRTAATLSPRVHVSSKSA